VRSKQAEDSYSAVNDRSMIARLDEERYAHLSSNSKDSLAIRCQYVLCPYSDVALPLVVFRRLSAVRLTTCT
jgi:hypothetical protein